MKKIHTTSRRGRRGHRWVHRGTWDELLTYKRFMHRVNASLAYLGLREAKW